MVPQNRLTLIIILALLAGTATPSARPSSTSASAEPSFDGEQNSSAPSPSIRPSPKIEPLDVTQLLLAPPEPQLPSIQPTQLFEQALQETFKISGQDKEWRKLEVIKNIVPQMAAAGQMKIALRAVSGLERKEDKVEVLSNIALELIKANQVNQASQIFEQALEITNAPSTNATTALVDLATKMIEGGQRKMALQPLSLAARIAETTKDDKYSITYRDILAINLAKVGQFEQALKIAETIQMECIPLLR